MEGLDLVKSIVNSAFDAHEQALDLPAVARVASQSGQVAAAFNACMQLATLLGQPVVTKMEDRGGCASGPVHGAVVPAQGDDYERSKKMKERESAYTRELSAMQVKKPRGAAAAYKYKTGVPRAKQERVKFPAHTCHDCQEFYGAGLTSTQREHLMQQCSRHRALHPPRKARHRKSGSATCPIHP